MRREKRSQKQPHVFIEGMVFSAALLAGPFVGLWMMYKTYKALGMQQKARLTYTLGIPLVVAALIGFSYLPVSAHKNSYLFASLMPFIMFFLLHADKDKIRSAYRLQKPSPRAAWEMLAAIIVSVALTVAVFFGIIVATGRYNSLFPNKPVPRHLPNDTLTTYTDKELRFSIGLPADFERKTVEDPSPNERIFASKNTASPFEVDVYFLSKVPSAEYRNFQQERQTIEELLTFIGKSMDQRGIQNSVSTFGEISIPNTSYTLGAFFNGVDEYQGVRLMERDMAVLRDDGSGLFIVTRYKAEYEDQMHPRVDQVFKSLQFIQ